MLSLNNGKNLVTVQPVSPSFRQADNNVPADWKSLCVLVLSVIGCLVMRVRKAGRYGLRMKVLCGFAFQ